MPYKQITEQIKKIVKKLSYVDSFYIHGSRGVGKHSSTSDIDYMFLLKKKRYVKKLKKDLRDLLEFKRISSFCPGLMWETCTLREKSLQFNDIGFHAEETKQMLKIFSKLFKSKKYFLKYQDHAQFLIKEAKVVYDPKGYVKKLKKLVSKYPTKLSKQIVKDQIQDLRTRLFWHGDPWFLKNKYTFIGDIKIDLFLIAQAHYAKNKTFLMNSMKRWHQNMKKFKPNIKKELDDLLRIDKNFSKEDKSIPFNKIIKKLEK